MRDMSFNNLVFFDLESGRFLCLALDSLVRTALHAVLILALRVLCCLRSEHNFFHCLVVAF